MAAALVSRKRDADITAEELHAECLLSAKAPFSFKHPDIEEMKRVAGEIADLFIAKGYLYLDEDPEKNRSMAVKQVLTLFLTGPFHPTLNLHSQYIKVSRIRDNFIKLRLEAPEDLTRAYIHFSGFPFFGKQTSLQIFNDYIQRLEDECLDKYNDEERRMRAAGAAVELEEDEEMKAGK